MHKYLLKFFDVLLYYIISKSIIFKKYSFKKFHIVSKTLIFFQKLLYSFKVCFLMTLHYFIFSSNILSVKLKKKY